MRKEVAMFMREFVLALLLFTPLPLFSQEYVLSVQFKSSALFVEQFRSSHCARYIDLYPLSIYVGNKFRIDDNYQLEMSPGFFFGGENFSGIELGVYLRRKIHAELLFGSLGVNMHYNLGNDHGLSVEEHAPQGIFVNIAASTGVNFNRNVSFLISYIQPLSEDYGYSIVSVVEDGSTTICHRKLFRMIQAGFEFNL
jgi:hypothetical protein